MAVVAVNNATTTIAAAITATQLSITLAAGSGALYPTLAAGQVFYGIITQGNLSEIVEVTARTTDTLTVVRGADGTAPSPFNQGALFQWVLNAATLNSYQPDFGTAYVAKTGGSRALGTVYTNTSGTHLCVAVVTTVTASGLLTATIAGVAILSRTVAVGTGAIFFIVPPGATYEVTVTGTQTLSTWNEM